MRELAFWPMWLGRGLAPAVLLASLLGSIAAAQSDDKPQPEGDFAYTAKVICGLQDDAENMRLARGFYATAVNIRNPNHTVATYSTTLALTFPPDEQKPGEVKFIGRDQLGAGEALEVDCIDIKVRLFPYGFPRSHIKGFVVIQSTHSLDVSAVYTATAIERERCCDKCCDDRCCNTTAVPHSSIDVEQIRERSRHAERRPSLPDLVPEAPFPQESELGAPGTGFCVKPSGGGPSQALRVYVKNTGDALADASTTRVEFDLHGDAKKPTSTIAGGGQEALEFPIPRGCYGSASTGFCKFKITVDSEGKVTESHETNNSVQSLCRVLPD